MTTNENDATQAPSESVVERSSTRGRFLRALGLAAGAAVAGRLTAAETAAAADGQNTVLGNANTSAHQTSVTMTVSGSPDAVARSAVMGRVNTVDHFGVTGQGVGSTTGGGTGNAAGVWGDARTGLVNLPILAPQNRWGVLGTSDIIGVVGVSEATSGPGGIGVNGFSNHPNNGTGVWGQADGVNGTGRVRGGDGEHRRCRGRGLRLRERRLVRRHARGALDRPAQRGGLARRRLGEGRDARRLGRRHVAVHRGRHAGNLDPRFARRQPTSPRRSAPIRRPMSAPACG